MFRHKQLKHLIGMLLAAMLLAPATLSAQTDLDLGDIAINGYNSDAPDGWVFVLLADIVAGTTVTFTDTGWLAAGGFNTTENILTWTATSAMVAGDQVVIDATIPSASTGSVAGDTFGLSNSGDQLFAYQGTAPTAGDESNFLAAIQMNGAWDADSTGERTSAQPSVFTDGVNSLSIDPEVDNGLYDCSVTGPDVATIRTAINTASNWTTSGSVVTLMVCDFSAVPVELMSFSID